MNTCVNNSRKDRLTRPGHLIEGDASKGRGVGEKAEYRNVDGCKAKYKKNKRGEQRESLLRRLIVSGQSIRNTAEGGREPPKMGKKKS